MKNNCGIIRDLLPLYNDGAASEESKKAIEEHLKVCPDCRKYNKRIKTERVISCVPDSSPASLELINVAKRIRIRKVVIMAVFVLIVLWGVSFATDLVRVSGNEAPIFSVPIGETYSDDDGNFLISKCSEYYGAGYKVYKYTLKSGDSYYSIDGIFGDAIRTGKISEEEITAIEDCIAQTNVVTKQKTEEEKGKITFASIAVIACEDIGDNEKKVYLWAQKERFDVGLNSEREDGTGYEQDYGESLPLVATISTENGKTEVTDLWAPRDGGFYSEDIKQACKKPLSDIIFDIGVDEIDRLTRSNMEKLGEYIKEKAQK